MVQQLEQLKTPQAPEIIYPDSDGQPMADNTTQFNWIVTIKENIEFLFAANDVFVAGDLLWYPVEGNNKIKIAPDVMVVFGRPKGKRGSYKQWEEDNIPPQVVFEILSPGNRPGEMTKKFELYDRYGVEEYYLYDPDNVKLTGWLRRQGKLQSIDQMDGWVSPRLKVRFDLTGPELQIFTESGDRFLTYSEIREGAKREQQRAEREQQRAERAEAKIKMLYERLQELGIDPEQL